jgi:hypothetical protein
MQTIQSKAKALVALVLGFLGPLVTFYQVNQNLTLKQLVAALVSGVVTGVAVHQVKNK